MCDIVVTVPAAHWPAWLEEGDLAGDPATGSEYGFSVSSRPPCKVGERCYVVARGLLRGWAPVTGLLAIDRRWLILRRGDAVACTIDEPIVGFRGWRERWWPREAERPFPDWRTAEVRVRGTGRDRDRQIRLPSC